MKLVKRLKTWLKNMCLYILREEDTLDDLRRNYCNYSKRYRTY